MVQTRSLERSEAAHPELSAGCATDQLCLSLSSVSLPAKGKMYASFLSHWEDRMKSYILALSPMKAYQLLPLMKMGGISSVCKVA